MQKKMMNKSWRTWTLSGISALVGSTLALSQHAIAQRRADLSEVSTSASADTTQIVSATAAQKRVAVSGRVFRQGSSAPLSQVLVTLKNAAGQTLSTTSDNNGRFSLLNVPTGVWTVSASRGDCWPSFRLAAPRTGNSLQISAGITNLNIEFFTLPEKSMVIRNTAVTNSQIAAFSPRFLFEQMTPAGVDPADFVKDIFSGIATSTSINGFPVTPRPAIRTSFLDTWPRTANGKLDLNRAPLRLLAIVNRLDLSSESAVDNAFGEGRFAFGLLDPAGEPLQATMILEYGLPSGNGNQSRRFWANAWQQLATLGGQNEFNAQYVQTLELLTRMFTTKGMGIARPNGSALNQLRTNEIAFGSPWELREWRWNVNTRRLEPAATANNPHGSFNTTRAPELVSWLRKNRASVVAGTHQIPIHFLGGASPSEPESTWRLRNLLSADPLLRKSFAINTCNGCHLTETGTTFTHVSPRSSAVQADLSQFLTDELNKDAAGTRRDKFLALACPSKP